MCLGVFLFASNFFGTLWTSWKSISFAILGKFSFIICSNKFSMSCCCSSPSPNNSDIGVFKVVLEVPKHLFSFFEFLFLHSVPVGCLFLPFVPNHWFESWFPSCHCWFPEYFALFHFEYLSFFNQAKSVLRAFWLPGFWTLHQIDWLSPHRLALFLEFCSVLSFGPYFFVSVHLLSCKGAGP